MTADVVLGRGSKLAPVAVLAIVLAVATVPFLRSWTRAIAWLMAVVLLIPNDGRYIIGSGLPFQLEPYRVAVAVLLAGWGVGLLVDPKVRFRKTTFDGPLILIGVSAVLSDAANPGRVSGLESAVIKAVWLLICCLLFVYMTVSVLHTRASVERLLTLLVCSGCFVAVIAVYQRQSGINLFNDLHRFLPILHYFAPAAEMMRGGHVRATASAGHPIELSSTMSMLMPLAIYMGISRKQRIWYGAACLLLLGVFASGSRTGILGIIAMVGVFLYLRPRQTRRCWPALIPVLVVVHLSAPGALGNVYGAFFPSGGLIAQQSNTVNGAEVSRLSRWGTSLHSFEAHNPLFGEGYGTRITGDTRNTGVKDNAQILDDEWLTTLLETGLVGVFAWIWLFGRVIRRLFARARIERDTPAGWLPVAIAASLLGFAVSMATYDAFAFIQATFIAFALVAFSSVLLQLPPETGPAA